MAPRLSIIIPHKSTILNDEAMHLNIQMLFDNTVMPYELIIDTETPKDPYMIWNEASKHARGEYLVFSNSDVLMGPDWDVYMVTGCEYNSIVTGYLVEPGNIGVASVNIHKDFGRSPQSFKRGEFERFAANERVLSLKEERGWYMPCCVRKDWFLSTGGFPTDIPFPNPNDIIFWERCIEEYGTKLLRANSFAYHFQNLSARV